MSDNKSPDCLMFGGDPKSDHSKSAIIQNLDVFNYQFLNGKKSGFRKVGTIAVAIAVVPTIKKTDGKSTHLWKHFNSKISGI